MEPKTLRGQALYKTVALPDGAAGQFSKHMMAALGALRDMADEQGRCRATDMRISELAGIGMSTTRAAIKRARTVGLIAIENTHRGKRVIINRCIGAQGAVEQ